MDIKEVFQGIANKLLVDFDQIHSQIDHAGERGRQREKAVEAFLVKYLPKKYSIGTGHVIDRQGNISKQCDIVIYDAFNCPLLLVEEGYQLFPAEAVFGVIEVKSVFDASTAEESVQNIQSVKGLEREEPIAGCVFAYRSRYKTEPKIEAAAYALSRVNKSVPPRERIDLVCILADGVLLDYKGSPNWGEGEEGAIQVHLDAEPSVLLLFLYYVMTILEERHSSMPNLIAYASQGEIGTVRAIPAAE
jgi:hypothetical protein